VPFVGHSHVLQQKDASKRQGGLSKRLASVLCLDPTVLLHHGEVLWRNGVRMTELRSASYGHTVGGGIGLAMLEDENEPITKSYIESAQWDVEVGNDRYACEVSLKPFYDPKNLRIKG
jgi:glycine cleavage system aminomethyltransferase T